MAMQHGIFTISLDFELYWGVRDNISLDRYRDNLLNVREVVPSLLTLFQRNDIHATWATVGFLFFETKEALLAGLPATQPAYRNTRLSPYLEIDRIGANEREDPFHYAPSLIRLIASHRHQEIASHTFSHYYCLESGQTEGDFRADLEAAQAAASPYGLTLRSLVIPRNQYNLGYIAVCEDLGFSSYRGNPGAWMYRPRIGATMPLAVRAMRLADTYINLSPHLCVDTSEIAARYPSDIRASRYLRPYTPQLAMGEPYRLRRILGELTRAAKTGTLYHLWWHPHNFGAHQGKNLAFLARILDHFAELRKNYGMESRTMAEVAEVLACRS